MRCTCPYADQRNSFYDYCQCLRFIRASKLYDVKTGSRTLTQATDDDVSDAVDELEADDEATDEEIREIFAGECPNGQTGRPVEEIEPISESDR